MPSLPSSLALTTIPDGSSIIAADHRNNYTAIQTDVNGVITCLSSGTTDQFLSTVGTTVAPAFTPGHEYAYNEFTANVTATVVAEAVAVTVVTATAVTFDGSTVVWVEFYAPEVVTGSTAGNDVVLTLWDGATDLGRIGRVVTPAAAANDVPVRVGRRLTPSAAAHTYTVRAHATGNSGIVGAAAGGASTNLPGYIRITKV